MNDVTAIQNLKSQYLRNVDLICDAKNPAPFALMHSIFTEDAVLDFGPLMGTYVGQDGIALIFGELLPAQHNWTWHSIGSPHIVIDGDRAAGRWTLYALSNPRAQAPDVQLATFGVYADEFILTAEGWRQSRLGFTLRGQSGGNWAMPDQG